MFDLTALHTTPIERVCNAAARAFGERQPRPASGIYLRSLGELQVLVDGRCVTPQGRARDLLVCLLSRGAREVRASAVATELWPHGETDYALGALNTTLYRLRRRPGLARLVRLHDGFIGIDARHCEVDRWLLDAALDSAVALLELGGPTDAAELDGLLSLLVTLYRGPLLEGEDSAAAVRARLRLRLRIASVTASAGHWQRRHGGGGRDWLRSVAAADPCDELLAGHA